MTDAWRRYADLKKHHDKVCAKLMEADALLIAEREKVLRLERKLEALGVDDLALKGAADPEEQRHRLPETWDINEGEEMD